MFQLLIGIRHKVRSYKMKPGFIRVLCSINDLNALWGWFGHDPDKWKEFQRLYQAELNAHPNGWKALLDAARQGHVTLLYSARDTEHNNAIVLKKYLEERMLD